MNGNHFDTYEDHNYYLLAEDALRCISYDFYFSPTYKYYCGAGCKVCYIRENLTEGVNHYAKSIPEEITQADTDYWYSIFKNFYSIRTDDDLRYLKKHHNHVYQWYVENASIFEFGMTDNSILMHHKILMNEVHLKGIADITLSEEFLLKTEDVGKVKAVIVDYLSKYSIGHVKIIRTSEDYHHPDQVTRMIEFLTEYDVVFSVHGDFREQAITKFDLAKFDNQNRYNITNQGRRHQIHRSSVHLFNNQFYFSYDDASDINVDPFHTIDKSVPFSSKEFLPNMLKGKLKYYKRCVDTFGIPDNSLSEKFLDYFKNTANFKVNDNYSFIPDFMLSDQSTYFHSLLKEGFVKTHIGLYDPNLDPVPLIEYK